MIKLETLTTEQRNPRTLAIDEVSTLEMMRLLNDEDGLVPLAVGKILPSIAAAVDVIAAALAAGGRLFYLGAGTSGRLGILDAVECPPTYRTDPEKIIGLIAGGTPAIFRAQEGAEDSEELGANDLREHAFSEKDVVVGIAASGRTPYVIGALKYAKRLGAKTIALACTTPAAIAEVADIALLPIVGPEAVTGSTRMKAGTAEKLVLNMLSTGAMVKLGKTYGNLMVDVKASNAKLTERATRIVMEVAECSREEAASALRLADGRAKLAILCVLTGEPIAACEAMLERHAGRLRSTLAEEAEERGDADDRNEALAQEILRAVEAHHGSASLIRAYNCMTRLRLSFEEAAGIPIGLAEAIQTIPGVLGTNPDGAELQVILGPGKAANVATALSALLAERRNHAVATDKQPPSSTVPPSVSDIAANASSQDARPQIGDGKALHAKIRAKNATPVKLFFKRIASIFIPLIPGFIACGLISGALNVVGKLDPAVTSGPAFQLLAIAGSTVFWGMNILVGRNAMAEFGGTPVLGAILGALLAHPGLANITLFEGTLVPGRGGVISVLLVALLASAIERQVRRFVPEALSLFVTPLLTFLASGTAAILVLQPVGGFLSDLIGGTATGAIAAGGAFTGAVLGGTFLPMVMLGIHQTLTPIHAELLARYGVTILLPVLAMAGAGQVGASFAVYLKTKNARLKKIIASALPVGILGVGEPLIYGVTLPLGKPFLGACVGGACGGAVQAAFGVGAATLGISGLPLAAATDNIPIYLAGLACAYVGGFFATLAIGFDDPAEAPAASERKHE